MKLLVLFTSLLTHEREDFWWKTVYQQKNRTESIWAEFSESKLQASVAVCDALKYYFFLKWICNLFSNRKRYRILEYLTSGSHSTPESRSLLCTFCANEHRRTLHKCRMRNSLSSYWAVSELMSENLGLLGLFQIYLSLNSLYTFE